MIDQLVRSRRRTLALHITSDAQLVVRAPRWATRVDIDALVNDKRDWILKTQRAIREVNAEHAALQLQDPDSFAYLGERRRRVSNDEGSVAWYGNEARAIFTERAALFSQRSGLPYKSLRITGAKTRWGSCSSQGALNFTWRLVMAPLWIIDYVIAHEISHLAHHNHSRRFWSHVAQLYPNFKAARTWLRKNQSRLTRPFPTLGS
jgi:predicted metal-dependent hydrolase